MSVPTLLCLLVLFSTHGWAPQDKHSSVSYSCTSEERALPCKDSYPSSWTVALDLPSETRPHSLVSIISGHPPGSLLWFDPVSVVTTVISGAGVLFLLGVTAWVIVIFVWIACNAVVSRINPLTISVKTNTRKYRTISVADMKLRQQLLFVLKSVAFLTIPLVDYAMLVQLDELTPTSQRAVITSREQTLIATFITTVLCDATFLLLYARNQSTMQDIEIQQVQTLIQPTNTDDRELKTILIHIPNQGIVTAQVKPNLRGSHLKQLISSKSGLSHPNVRLFYQNKPIPDTFCLDLLPNDANIVATLMLKGGTTPCDVCYSPGEFTCSECNQTHCKDCSIKMHKHPSRQHHSPRPITQSTTSQVDISDLTATEELSSQSTSDCEYGLQDSPGTSQFFEQAAMAMTLAERFNLTKFRDYQKRAINAIQEGRDCMIIQPTGSGKSLCYQFPPVYQNKKSLVITPTISLMKDQVTNCTEKGIQAAYLGSAQPDKSLEDRVLLPDSAENVIFVTPEWISKPERKEKVQQLVKSNKISLIALDEAHLFHLWPHFRSAYKELEYLKDDFPTIPLIALTATAPPDVEQSIHKLLRTPLIIKESVNRPNIFLSCEELPYSGEKGLSYFASRVSEVLDGNSAIIYTDFIDDIGPIVSELAEYDIECVAYHGEMDAQSRHTSYSKWRNGEVKVMVATTAFGMGIDKPDIRNIIRYGVPENICSWAQELGRAGRDGLPSRATIFYSMSDTEHAGAWVKGNLHDSDACTRILNDFAMSWKYTMSHLVHKCRRVTLLEMFGENVSQLGMNSNSDKIPSNCCDVCDQTCSESCDVTEELSILHDAINVIGQKGEVKLAQWIRGSSLSWTDAYDKNALSYGYSTQHSEMWWRIFMRQCHVLGLVHRQLRSIKKQSQHYSVQGLYTVAHKGIEFVRNGERLLIPTNTHNQVSERRAQITKSNQIQSQSNPSEKRVRKGKGMHGLTVVRRLIECKENWKTISKKDDYQFPGVFDCERDQFILYTDDCRKLGQSCEKKYHFMWDDIQLSKGTWRDREVKINMTNEGETILIYRSAPCNGVKLCPEKECEYVAPISAQRPCATHGQKLIRSSNISGPCPVEFGYLYPKHYQDDHRRWILGFVRHQKVRSSNIHNHPMNAASKICSKVKESIAQATLSNPTIKPSEIAKGKGIPFVPGAVDQASAHIGRISREVQRAKKLTHSGTAWSTTDFEKVADDIDKRDDDYSGNSPAQQAKLKELSRPYLISAGYDQGINYVFTMNPMMSKILAQSEFIEADITYNETKEYPYLFNVAAFDDVTMRWTVVSRVRMDKQDKNAYKFAFNKTFDKCKLDHPTFQPGTSLLGVIIDWSDAEIQGLGRAVGPDVARKLLRGCSVHWSRSWQRVRNRVLGSSNKGYEKRLFSIIASHIQKASCGQQVALCFEVLCGSKSASALLGFISNFTKDDALFIDNECDWSIAKSWASWWTRPRHLEMLHKDYSKMDDIVWEKCPSDTNAVERKNRDSKEGTPNILRSAMINLYKLDKSECAKHLAASNGVSLSYNDRSEEARKSAAKKRNVQCAQKVNSDSTTEHGPPDRQCHFEKERLLAKRQSQHTTYPKSKRAKRVQPPSSDDEIDDFMDTSESVANKTSSIVTASETGTKSMYKPPDASLLGKKLKMRFKVEGKLQWFEGQIMNYDGLTGKYGVYFPIDQETVYIYPNDKDIVFA